MKFRTGFWVYSGLLCIRLNVFPAGASTQQFWWNNTDNFIEHIFFKIMWIQPVLAVLELAAVRFFYQQRSRTFLGIIGLSHPAVSDQAKKCADGQPY